MDIALMIIAGLLMLTGLVGCVLPVLPGVPLAYVGLLLLQLTDKVQFSTTFMLIWLAVVIVIQVLDYYVPAWGTKQFGGSKWGVWGCTIGLLLGVVGLPLGPGGIAGLFFWPFVGALVGEYLKQRDTRIALRAAVGSFIGMMTGIVAKVAYGVVLLAIIIVKLF